MKIIAIDAIDIKSFGGLVHLEQIITTLSKKRYRIKVLSNSFIKKKINKKRNIQVINKKIFDKNYFVRYLWKTFFYKKILDKYNCELLLSLNGIYHGIFKPTILFNQNILPFDEFSKKKYSLISKFKFFLQKIALLISIHLHKNVIFTSHDLRTRVLRYFKNKKLIKNKVIYHAVKKVFKTKKKRLNKNKVNLLYISTFQEYKNHEKLFEALENDNKKRINLTCIGNDNFNNLKKLKLRFNLKKLKIKIINHFPHNKILNIYKNYDALIFPSLAEAFGYPVLEASINKLPIICSNLIVFKEIYKNGCFYFNPVDSHSILNQINYFLLVEKNKINVKLKQNYNKAQKLNLHYFGENYHQIIQNTLNKNEKK